MDMPEKLKQFLSSLNEEDATAVWSYLDSNEDAVFDMIDIVAPLAEH